MAIIQAAILFDARLPTLDQIETLTRNLGYNLTFTEKPDLRIHRGPIALLFEGRETGFDTAYEIFDSFAPVPATLEGSGDRLLEITTSGGDFTAGLVANVFLRAFCQLSAGGWWYLDHDEFYQLPGTTDGYFDEQIEAYRSHIAKQSNPLTSLSPAEPKVSLFKRFFL